MRRDGAKTGQCGARAADELVFDVENGFRDHGEIAFKKQVINADDGASERIFNGSEQRAGSAFRNSGKGGIERGARDSSDGFAEKLNGGGFAEGAGFALEGDPGRV